MSAWCLVLTPFSVSPLSFSISLPEVSFDIPLGCPSGEKHPYTACNLWSIPPQKNSARHTSCNFDHIWNAPCLKDTCLLTETQQPSPISQFRYNIKYHLPASACIKRMITVPGYTSKAISHTMKMKQAGLHILQTVLWMQQLVFLPFLLLFCTETQPPVFCLLFLWSLGNYSRKRLIFTLG